ncbi:hypothetical protein KJ780_04645 [Candidatus Micrarchaeota archaeon]|nr:hypothetical protein [Candidatus Micrarchaeota archaeon]
MAQNVYNGLVRKSGMSYEQVQQVEQKPAVSISKVTPIKVFSQKETGSALESINLEGNKAAAKTLANLCEKTGMKPQKIIEILRMNNDPETVHTRAKNMLRLHTSEKQKLEEEIRELKKQSNTMTKTGDGQKGGDSEAKLGDYVFNFFGTADRYLGLMRKRREMEKVDRAVQDINDILMVTDEFTSMLKSNDKGAKTIAQSVKYEY